MAITDRNSSILETRISDMDETDIIQESPVVEQNIPDPIKIQGTTSEQHQILNMIPKKFRLKTRSSDRLHEKPVVEENISGPFDIREKISEQQSIITKNPNKFKL